MGKHLSPRTMIASLLAASLLVLPASASAGEPLQLIVDTSKLAESDRESFGASIRDGVSQTLATEGREVLDTATTTLRVRVEYLSEENLDYTIVYELLRGEEPLGAAPAITCSGCVEAKLVRTIGEGLPAALAELDTLAAEPEEEPKPVEQPAEEPPAPRVAPIGALGIAGSVLAAGGIATLIFGGLELPKGREPIPTDGPEREVREHAKTGQLLLATGAGVLVVGVAMLATDVVLRSKRNRAATSRVARMPTPLLAPGFVGMGLSGRF